MLSDAPKRLAKDALNEGAGTKAEMAEEKVECAEEAGTAESASIAEMLAPTSTAGCADTLVATEAEGGATVEGKAGEAPATVAFSNTYGAVESRAG